MQSTVKGFGKKNLLTTERLGGAWQKRKPFFPLVASQRLQSHSLPLSPLGSASSRDRDMLSLRRRVATSTRRSRWKSFAGFPTAVRQATNGLLDSDATAETIFLLSRVLHIKIRGSFHCRISSSRSEGSCGTPPPLVTWDNNSQAKQSREI